MFLDTNIAYYSVLPKNIRQCEYNDNPFARAGRSRYEPLNEPQSGDQRTAVGEANRRNPRKNGTHGQR